MNLTHIKNKNSDYYIDNQNRIQGEYKIYQSK